MHAVAEAARNCATSGARPYGRDKLPHIREPGKTVPDVAIQRKPSMGLTIACNELGTPITGREGIVSFYNETLGKSIYPTPGDWRARDSGRRSSRVLKDRISRRSDVIVLLAVRLLWLGHSMSRPYKNDSV